MAKATPITVTSVKVFEFKAKKGKANNLKAFASITLNEAFVVTGLKILEGKKGLFVTMPQTSGKDNEYFDVAFPLSKELREEITDAVIAEYEDPTEDEEEEEKPKRRTSKRTSDED